MPIVMPPLPWLPYPSNANTQDAIKRINEHHSEEEAQFSDLVPGVYEGGFKVWECTDDLYSYMATSNRSGKRVLDLGCGNGILGIAAFKYLQANHVLFQDYNDSVITKTTMPNYRLNEEDASKATFISGSWAELNQVIDRKSIDIILTSETIYCLDRYPELVDVFSHCLSDDGFVLLAAKVHYFGVGGGLRLFEKALEKAGFQYKTLQKFDEGVKREIIEISRNAEGKR